VYFSSSEQMGMTNSENSYLLLKSFSNYLRKEFTLISGLIVLTATSEIRPYYLSILFFYLFTIIRNIIIDWAKQLFYDYDLPRNIIICFNDFRQEWNQHFWSFCFWLFWQATPPPIASVWAASGWTPASPSVRTSDS
jgi:hypothetical protein